MSAAAFRACSSVNRSPVRPLSVDLAPPDCAKPRSIASVSAFIAISWSMVPLPSGFSVMSVVA